LNKKKKKELSMPMSGQFNVDQVPGDLKDKACEMAAVTNPGMSPVEIFRVLNIRVNTNNLLKWLHEKRPGTFLKIPKPNENLKK